MSDESSSSPPDPPKRDKFLRAGMEIAGGAIPFAGGLLSAAASAWSEHEQDEVNKFFRQWLKDLEDELREKAKTIFEIAARIDMQDEKQKERLHSEEFQSILRKAFRNWSRIDSEAKRQKVRNLLANAAASSISSDDVVRLFLAWILQYSDFHFAVVGEIYRNDGITRGEIWQNLGKGPVREDSQDADLFKLLIRDLSTGGLIRQHRETDASGRFLKKERSRTARPFQRSNDPYAKSAFDDQEGYELTQLGQQFVHYAMNELAPKIEYHGFDAPSEGKSEGGQDGQPH